MLKRFNRFASFSTGRPNGKLMILALSAWIALPTSVTKASELSADPTTELHPQPEWSLFSPEHEVQLGSELASELESSVVLIRNRAAASYIERVGQRVVGSFSTPEFRPSFRLLADPTLYSVGLPGGGVYLTQGLARLAKSESELAALTAHESAHTLLRHVTSAISRAARIRVRVAFETASRGDLSLLKALEVIDLDSGLQSGFFKYGATHEQDALDLAGDLLAASGYDRLSLSNVLESIVVADELRASPFSIFHSEAVRLFLVQNLSCLLSRRWPQSGNLKNSRLGSTHAMLPRASR